MWAALDFGDRSQAPSLGHWLLGCWEKQPVGGAALPQREGPWGLTDLASLRAASSAPGTAEAALGQRSWAPSSPASKCGERNAMKRSPSFSERIQKVGREGRGESLPKALPFKMSNQKKSSLLLKKLVRVLLSGKEALAPTTSRLGQASLEAVF